MKRNCMKLFLIVFMVICSIVPVSCHEDTIIIVSSRVTDSELLNSLQEEERFSNINYEILTPEEFLNSSKDNMFYAFDIVDLFEDNYLKNEVQSLFDDSIVFVFGNSNISSLKTLFNIDLKFNSIVYDENLNIYKEIENERDLDEKFSVLIYSENQSFSHLNSTSIASDDSIDALVYTVLNEYSALFDPQPTSSITASGLFGKVYMDSYKNRYFQVSYTMYYNGSNSSGSTDYYFLNSRVVVSAYGTKVVMKHTGLDGAVQMDFDPVNTTYSQVTTISLSEISMSFEVPPSVVTVVSNSTYVQWTFKKKTTYFTSGYPVVSCSKFAVPSNTDISYLHMTVSVTDDLNCEKLNYGYAAYFNN